MPIGRTQVYNLCSDRHGSVIAVKRHFNGKKGRVVSSDELDRYIDHKTAQWQAELDDRLDQADLLSVEEVLGWRVNDDE